jgi:hypothetical protein
MKPQGSLAAAVHAGLRPPADRRNRSGARKPTRPGLSA